jgi:hypothetical protein
MSFEWIDGAAAAPFLFCVGNYGVRSHPGSRQKKDSQEGLRFAPATYWLISNYS